MGLFSKVLLLPSSVKMQTTHFLLLPFIGQDGLRYSAPQDSPSIEHFPLERLVPLTFTPLKKNGNYSILSTRTKAGLLFSSV